jgi:hypothetical protein
MSNFQLVRVSARCPVAGCNLSIEQTSSSCFASLRPPLMSKVRRLNPGPFMYHHFAYAFGIALAALPTLAMPQEQINPTPLVVVDQTRQYAQGTFPRDAQWLGLYCQGLECEIKPTPVRVTTSSAKNVLDVDESLDVLNVKGMPLALFPDAPLKTGKVASWYQAKEPSFDIPQTQKLQKLGKLVVPWGARPLTISWVKTPERLKRYHLSDGNTKQFLFSTDFSEEKTPFIHWVGDLDRDGRPDILLSIPDDNCGFDERLFLSSNAGEGRLVRMGAQLTGRQAACGC